jgi:hypothetical protein
MTFFEVCWHGEAIDDATDPHEALAGFAMVRPDDGDWHAACAVPGADPCLLRYASFEAFLHNADALETIPVSAAMIEAALADADVAAPAPADPALADPAPLDPAALPSDFSDVPF